jgi:hypothetical protein
LGKQSQAIYTPFVYFTLPNQRLLPDLFYPLLCSIFSPLFYPLFGVILWANCLSLSASACPSNTARFLSLLSVKTKELLQTL